jgi:hypothetical protein
VLRFCLTGYVRHFIIFCMCSHSWFWSSYVSICLMLCFYRYTSEKAACKNVRLCSMI